MTFSSESYSRIIEFGISKDVKFYKISADQPSAGVYLRHDVDLHPMLCQPTFDVELKLGVRSTVYVMIDNPFYSLREKQIINYLRRLIIDGFEVGLHFEWLSLVTGKEQDFVSEFELAVRLLEDVCEHKIRSFSLHQPREKTPQFNTQGLVSAYDPTKFHPSRYLSDSRMSFRSDPLEFVSRGVSEVIQLLTHPEYYGDSPTSPEKVCRSLRSLATERQLEYLSENTLLQQEFMRINGH